MFLILYSVGRPNLFARLPLLLEIWSAMGIAMICFQGCDVINFETNLIFLIKPFCYMIKKLRQRFKYHENEKSF